MQIRVETVQLRESASQLAEVLARLDRVRVADDLAGVGSAFRGGQVAAVNRRVCGGWADGLSALRGRVRATGSALEVAATGYAGLEDVARRALGGTSVS